MNEICAPIVIDHGSTTTRVGVAGQDDPCTILPSVLGYEKNQVSSKCYIGNEALAKQGDLILKRPISGGLIHNWDEIEKLWHYIYDEQLRVDSRQHPVLITEPPFNFKNNREKILQIIFENFDVPALYLIPNIVLSLFASGRTTGLVLTLGGEICTTYAVPIYEGHQLPYSACRIPCLGGNTLTDTLRDMLATRYSFLSAINFEVIRDIKEKLCYLALDFEKELRSPITNSESYTLPDGRSITVGKERFQCPEVLFQPNITQLECEGIHGIVYNAIMKSDETIRKTLFANIVLYGGSTMFSGIQERLQKEVSGIVKDTVKVKVIAPARRDLSAWYGGALLASMPQFLKMCVLKDEYDEYGPSLVHRKCF